MTESEIARALGLSRTTARLVLHRAIAKMAIGLGGRAPTPAWARRQLGAAQRQCRRTPGEYRRAAP